VREKGLKRRNPNERTRLTNAKTTGSVKPPKFLLPMASHREEQDAQDSITVAEPVSQTRKGRPLDKTVMNFKGNKKNKNPRKWTVKETKKGKYRFGNSTLGYPGDIPRENEPQTGGIACLGKRDKQAYERLAGKKGSSLVG